MDIVKKPDQKSGKSFGIFGLRALEPDIQLLPVFGGRHLITGMNFQATKKIHNFYYSNKKIGRLYKSLFI